MNAMTGATAFTAEARATQQKNFHIAAGGDDWVTLYWKDSAAEGFPGSVSLEVTYRVTEDDALDIRYRLVPEEDTPVNLTNHAYFNLSGGRDADVLNHELRLMADFYTPAAPDMIPTGRSGRWRGRAWTLPGGES